MSKDATTAATASNLTGWNNNATATSNSNSSKPFEWLHGGLFFGGKKDNNNKNNNDTNDSDAVLQRIESEKDVAVLLDGIQENLSAVVIAVQAQAAAAAEAEAADTKLPPPTAGIAASTTTTTAPADATDPSSVSATTTTAAAAVPNIPSDFLAARLARLRFLLYDERRMTSASQDSHHTSLPFNLGGGGATAIPSVALNAVQCLSSKSLHATLLPQLILHLSILPFESRKHVAAIFNYLLVCGLDGLDRDLYSPIMEAFRDYIALPATFDAILSALLHGYYQHTTNSSSTSTTTPPSTTTTTSTTTTDVVLHCGSMYRSCFRKHAKLYRELVTTTDRVQRYIFPFLDTFAVVPNFDVSSDAMENVKVIMTAGTATSSDSLMEGGTVVEESDDDAAVQQELSELSAAFLTRDYDAVWEQRFNVYQLSPETNYMTKRVALQILSTVLLTRSNYAIMIRYVNSRSNLILVMKLLREPSPHITMDAFHVFKVFVANPHKLPEVEKILQDNSQKLCLYLESLHQDKESSDPQFAEEKKLIIATIRAL